MKKGTGRLSTESERDLLAKRIQSKVGSWSRGAVKREREVVRKIKV